MIVVNWLGPLEAVILLRVEEPANFYPRDLLLGLATDYENNSYFNVKPVGRAGRAGRACRAGRAGRIGFLVLLGDQKRDLQLCNKLQPPCF